jgi:hypothetical protein
MALRRSEDDLRINGKWPVTFDAAAPTLSRPYGRV